MFCKICHGDFDQEEALERVLGDERHEIFWVCIFANDIGLPLQPGKDPMYHLTKETVDKMSVEGIPVRYFHRSKPIGHVLFGWHIHWIDTQTFACACVATISPTYFKAGAPVLLTIACQSSLGTIAGVPDEISITQVGARDDTVGVFCQRNSLRQVLSRFQFFTANDVKAIKRDFVRASKFGTFDMTSLAETQSGLPVTEQPIAVDGVEAMVEKEGNDENRAEEMEKIAEQVQFIRGELDRQNESMDMLRGIMEEFSVKSLGELETSESPAASKIRKEVQNLVQRGVIRDPDNQDQPRVDDANALKELIKHNLHEFPNAVATSFRDDIINILEPSKRPTESVQSIGTNLNAVRASAYKVKSQRDTSTQSVNSTGTEPVRGSTVASGRQREQSSLRKIREALAEKWVPVGLKRKREHESSPVRHEKDDDSESNSNICKMIKSVIEKELEQWGPRHRFIKKKEEQQALYEDYVCFCEQREQQQQQQQQQLQGPPTTNNSTNVQSQPTTSNLSHPESSITQLPQEARQNDQTVVRASGLQVPQDTSSLQDLGIFY